MCCGILVFVGIQVTNDPSRMGLSDYEINAFYSYVWCATAAVVDIKNKKEGRR